MLLRRAHSWEGQKVTIRRYVAGSVACRSETVSSAIETGAPRLDSETWVHLFLPLTFSPRRPLVTKSNLKRLPRFLRINAVASLGLLARKECLSAHLGQKLPLRGF
jgi:hypothetical protein